MNDEVTAYLDKLSDPKQVNAIVFNALKMVGKEITNETKALGVFTGKQRNVGYKADQTFNQVEVSIYKGKRGYINRWINTGTKPRYAKKWRGKPMKNSAYRGQVTGKGLFGIDEADIESKYDRAITTIIENL